jgi:hypothetical protein
MMMWLWMAFGSRDSFKCGDATGRIESTTHFQPLPCVVIESDRQSLYRMHRENNPVAVANEFQSALSRSTRHSRIEGHFLPESNSPGDGWTRSRLNEIVGLKGGHRDNFGCFERSGRSGDGSNSRRVPAWSCYI